MKKGENTDPMPMEQEQIEMAKSKKRIELLTRAVMDAVKETSEQTESELGEFTLYEVNDVMLRIAHSYNKRFLDTQFMPKDGQ